MKSVFRPHGIFIAKCFRADGSLKWFEVFHNMNVDEGLTDILEVYFNGGTQSASWYVILMESNSTPAAGWTYANIGTDLTDIGTDFTEFTSYDGLTRPQWIPAAAVNKSITNNASPATFVASSGVDTTLYGAGMVNVSTKGDNADASGILWCATTFGAARPYLATEQIQIVYTLTSSDV